MKVLWISSAPIGPVSRILKLPYGGSSGTWIQAEYEGLPKNGDIQLSFMCPLRNQASGKIIKEESDEGIAYGIGYKTFIANGLKLPEKVERAIMQSVNEIKPDIIHIWGTETNFSAGCASLLRGFKTVIFIQGLIGIHQRYTNKSYVREKEYWGHISLYHKCRSAIKRRYFKKQISFEQCAILSAGNIITDNDFTRAYCSSFAPATKFYSHFMGPADLFYNTEWNIERCEKNTIFTIFASNEAKGLSQLLKALNIVKKSIPDIKLRIPGPFNVDNQGKLDRKRCSPFERWAANYIERNDLEDNVSFLGKLDREGMALNYSAANCFVCPSAMEVHSSSVREAMAVGMPVITSLCGSTIEFIDHRQSGLIYRYEEEEVLAYYIIKVLTDSRFASEIGKQAKLRMNSFRNAAELNRPLSDIYKTL